MPKKPAKEKQKKVNIDDLASTIARIIGKSADEIKQHMPSQEEVNSLPTDEEAVFEAQSVLNYFDNKGKGFYHRPCRVCEQWFAYAYAYPGIGICSKQCAINSLKKIGINWDPNKPLRDRYGPVMPAVVPPPALEILPDFPDKTICPKWIQQQEIENKKQQDFQTPKEPSDPVHIDHDDERYIDVEECTDKPQDDDYDLLSDVRGLLDL